MSRTGASTARRLARLAWFWCAASTSIAGAQPVPAEPAPTPAPAPTPTSATSPAPAPTPAVTDEIVLDWSARVLTGFELVRSQRSAAQGGREREDYGFFLDQARVQLEAERGALEAELSVDLADAVRPETSAAALKRPPYLRDAYLNARFTKALRLRAGHFKRPFSRIELTSSGALPVRGRGLTNSLIVEDAGFGDRALGLMLWGKLKGKLAYYAALSNPDWAADADLEPNGALASGRVQWEPVGALSLGLDFGHQVRVRSGADEHVNAAGFDVALDAGALDVVLDTRLAQLPEDVQAAPSASAPIAYGVVTYVTYELLPPGTWHLAPVLLGEYADANAGVSNDEAVRVLVGLTLGIGESLRIEPQVALVRSLRTASAESPWTNAQRYYVMFVGEF